jgi:hypothetical protein
VELEWKGKRCGKREGNNKFKREKTNIRKSTAPSQCKILYFRLLTNNVREAAREASTAV